MRYRRRYAKGRLPSRIQVGTVLETDFGPLTVLEVSLSTLLDEVWIRFEGVAPDGEIVEDHRTWDYIVRNYLR